MVWIGVYILPEVIFGGGRLVMFVICSMMERGAFLVVGLTSGIDGLEIGLHRGAVSIMK